MKNVLIAAAILLLIVGGYVVYIIDAAPETEPVVTEEMNENATSTLEVQGVVTALDLEGMMVDGPGLITIETDAGDAHTIAVPSMGIRLCAAYERITQAGVIEVGDRVSVRGEVNLEGQIVPCTEETDYLEVTETYRNHDIGLAFTYPKGSGGYVLEEDTERFSAHPEYVFGIMLTETRAYEELQESTDAREGPPTIQIRVYTNSENLWATQWVEQYATESNVGLAFNEPEEAVVGGANAVYYLADGLYAMDTYAVAHGDHLFLLTGGHMDQSGQIRTDFRNIINSVTFIPTPSQE